MLSNAIISLTPANAFSFTLKGVEKTAVAVADSPDFKGSRKLKSSWKNGDLTVTLPKELMKTYTIVKVK